ncbi:hypothetical protein C0995_005274 [Termitomyces sp. Mi166|nr:hypothetical protein C0995_005274 [Termitomyces sp. Mi166\
MFKPWNFDLQYTKLAKTRHWAYGKRASILAIPNELLETIFGNLISFFDVACLAMTCQRFYEVSQKRMEDELEKMLTISWVGDRIFCLGDRVRANDQLWNLTEDEVETLNLQIENDLELPFIEHFKHLRDKISSSRTILSSRDPYSNFRTFWRTFKQKFTPSTGDVERLQSLLKINLPTYADMYKPNTDPYILRNLNTHQYIRGEAFSGIDVSDHYDFNPKSLCFQMALMIMTMSCRPHYNEWFNLPPDDKHVTFPPDAALSHCGPWAGLRFDIVTLSRVEEPYIIPAWQPPDSPWTDASHYIIEKAMELFMVRGYDRVVHDYHEVVKHEEQDGGNKEFEGPHFCAN